MLNNPKALLAQAPKYFKNIGEIKTYKPLKITDIYGYQYLVKQEAQTIKGAIHTEKFLEENVFGRFNGASIILSTFSKMDCGDIIEANGDFYAIDKQKPYNDKLQECDYVCYSIYDYYKEFVIDTQDQANRILGANSIRYILGFKQTLQDIPLIPSMFAPDPKLLNKYISVDIYSSTPLSTPYKNEKGLIEQQKNDKGYLYALGLDTNELQTFAYDLFNNCNEIGFANFPSWQEEKRYSKEFDLKANLQRLELDLNYTITTTEPLEADKLLEKLALTLNGARLNFYKE